ncbi:hypothetical protein M1466_00125 [Candidatus Dependentiae bacterium]|nr:hypothetical protein [Candidatus Dependentiae bacterium]
MFLLVIGLIATFSIGCSFDTCQTVSQLLHENDALQLSHDSPVDKQTWDDLSFDQLLAATDRTITAFGSWGLQSLTVAAQGEQLRPSLDLFEHDLALRKGIMRELSRIATLQQSLLAQFDATDHVNQMAEVMYCQFMRESAKQYFFPQQFMSVAEKWHLAAQFLLGNPIVVGKVYRYGYAVGNDWGGHRKGQLTGIAAAGAICGILAMPLRKYFADAYRNACNAAILQQRLVDIAALLQIAIRMNALIQQHAVLAQHPAAAYLNKFMRAMDGKKMKSLRAVLAKPTFWRKADWRFLRGRVMQANLLLQDCKDSFIELMRAIALLDASISMVNFIQESTAQGKPWCRPQIVANDVVCAIEQGWLPLHSDVTVTNDLKLGGNDPRIMIVTGPNGTGKSTILKTISFIALMAQSWGYSPAHSCTISRFAYVRSHKNPREDMKNGKSTFMAQQERAAKLLQLSKEQVPQLIVLDEPFNGTLERQGEDRARDMIWALAQQSHVLVCAASHFYQPTTLARRSPTIIANYQMELLLDGSFTRTFRLLPGVASWWFEQEHYDLQKRFIERLGELQDFD